MPAQILISAYVGEYAVLRYERAFDRASELSMVCSRYRKHETSKSAWLGRRKRKANKLLSACVRASGVQYPSMHCWHKLPFPISGSTLSLEHFLILYLLFFDSPGGRRTILVVIRKS